MWFNNIFVRRGLDKVKNAPGNRSDYNIFLEGAERSVFGDEHSLVDPMVTGFSHEDHPLSVTIQFSMNGAPLRLQGPWVDGKLVGVFKTVGQTIEDRYGNFLKVATDIHGREFTRGVAGPLAEIKPGMNSFTWRKY